MEKRTYSCEELQQYVESNFSAEEIGYLYEIIKYLRGRPSDVESLPPSWRALADELMEERRNAC